MNFTDKQLIGLGIVALVIAAGGIWYARRTMIAVAEAVNPVDRDNVFNQAANSAFQSISGNNVDSIGTALYGLIHGD